LLLKQLLQKLTLFILVNLIFFNLAYASEINGIRFWQDPEKTRVVFDLSEDVKYKLFTLPNPSRLVVDIENSSLNLDLSKIELPKDFVKNIRGSSQPTKTRIVIDLNQKMTTNDFKLKPYQKFGHRLVVDLKPKNGKKKVTKTAESAVKNKNRDLVIVIDAGHGGEDPGAPGGEKGVNLAVAKKLAALINKEKGMKAVLTRTGDYFVQLRRRTDIARENRADLFISLHADGFTDKRVRGTSVWILSPKGADSEMGRWLEQKGNASDLAGGVDISHQDPLVAQVILDLSMNYSVGESLKAAELVRKQLANKMPKMHGKEIKKAAFVFLKMPDIPAFLVEMGFISNKTERKQLKSSKHQKLIAKSILSGVKTYFKSNAPDGSLYAVMAKSKSHEVKSGDTLSEIAQSYDIPISSLRAHNQLKNDRLKIGQIIQIPGV